MKREVGENWLKSIIYFIKLYSYRKVLIRLLIVINERAVNINIVYNKRIIMENLFKERIVIENYLGEDSNRETKKPLYKYL